MKSIVLYKSKYGNTQTYAKWIAAALGWELRDFANFKQSEIKNYDHVIFGSGVYMGKMNKIKCVLKWFKEKPIIIFACAGNNNDETEIERMLENNFSQEQRAFHTFFYLPGGVDFTKVKGPFKIMLNVFRKVLEKKKHRTADEEAILAGFHHPTNYVDERHIEGIVSYAKQITEESLEC